MGMHYASLADVREHMSNELKVDQAAGKLFVSNRLTPLGGQKWPGLLLVAVEQHDDEWLAGQLRANRLIIAQEQRRKPSGGYTMAAVPATAPDTLAEGEFNRFYIRGVCLQAIKIGRPTVEVYRAKAVGAPRAESIAKVGTHISPERLLADLRQNLGIDTALGLPAGPNSGLSVKL